MYLIRSVSYLLIFLAFSQLNFGEVVTVSKVKFTSLQQDWLMSEVEIKTGINDLPGSTNKRFIENVGIRLYLGFKSSSQHQKIDYYYSEVTALVLKRGDKNAIRFFMPGNVMEMKRYGKPDYYYAEIVINGRPTEPERRAFSPKLRSEGSLMNFVEMAKLGSAINKGFLMPSYLAPMEIVGINEDAPAYLRKN